MTVRAAELASQPGHYATDQFNNPYTIAGMRDSLGREILEQTDGRITAFVQGVGTASSRHRRLTGAQGAREASASSALEPAGSPAITGGDDAARSRCKAGRASCRRTGTLGRVDDVWTIADDEALEMTRGSRRGGHLRRHSSGANVVGALRLAEELDAGDVVVTLAVDSGFKYMTARRTRPSRAAARLVEQAAPRRRSRSATRRRPRAGSTPPRRTSPDERPQPLPLRTEDEHRAAGEIGLPERLLRVAGGRVDPEIVALDLLEIARKVRDDADRRDARRRRPTLSHRGRHGRGPCEGTTTPVAPAPSAARQTAPRLRGSVTRSRQTSSARSCAASSHASA